VGRIHFVWTAMEDQELWYARTDADGEIDNGPIRLTDASFDSAEVSIWMDPRDHLHLVWFDARDLGTWLYYMQLDRDGNKVVDDTPLVSARTEQESALVMDPNGDLHVLWNGPAPVTQIQWNYELHYTKVSPTGEVLVDDRLIATSRGTIGFPDAAMDLSNNIHVVWPEGVGPRERVNYARLDSSGRLLHGPVEVLGDVTDPARDIAIASDGNDRLHLVWSQGSTADSELHYMTMTSEGIAEGDPEQLTEATGASAEPAIGLSSKGEPRIVWSDRRAVNAEVFLKVGNLPFSGVDLAVYSRDITTEPATVVAGEEFKLLVEVHNHGNLDVESADFTVSLDGNPQWTAKVYNLVPGTTANFSIMVTLSEGDHLFTVTLDPENAIEETVEHNNVATRAVHVYPDRTLIADAGPDVQVKAGERVLLDGSGTVYLGDGVLSYDWTFGDGATGSGRYVEHTYDLIDNYEVTLRVSDGTVEDTDTCQVAVSERDDPPVAVIDPEGPITADRLEPVQLSAEGSTDDNAVVSVTWDMGDGTVLDEMTVSHLYAETGIYVVTLTVFDVAGQIGINKTTVGVVNLPPEVASVDGPDKVKEGDDATFSVSASDPDGEVSEVHWDFDAADGVSFEANGTEVTHAYEHAGTYNVTCIVRDDAGGQTMVHMEVVVEEKDTSGLPGMGSLMAFLALLIIALAIVWWRLGDD
jgi:PKD repeat protein